MLLRQAGQSMRLEAVSDVCGSWQVVEADTRLQPYDSPLPGVRMVSFETKMPDSGNVEIRVSLSDDGWCGTGTRRSWFNS